jgi:NAD(P)-dependent dehydrogenase (short-subunit alcohol dehydrogenase family)
MSIALVTGASSGIGAATAIAFAEAGWDVMAAGRDEGRLEEVADVSDNIAIWSGELSDSDECDELIADTIDEFGALDCLVNSAGILLRGDAGETSDDDWRDTMTINLDVPFFLCRAAIPHLQKTSGSIVNISSYWGLQAGARALAYSTSKGGLIMLTKALAKDTAADGIRVNAICPGGVDTPMLAAGAEAAGQETQEFLESVAEFSPNGRISTPEEVAGLALFLAGDAASQITGTAIPIDGGLAA